MTNLTKRPIAVWILSLILVASLYFAANGWVDAFKGYMNEASFQYIGLLIIDTSILVVVGIFIVIFFSLQKQAKQWVHIAFSVSLIGSALSDILQQSPIDAFFFLSYGATLILWWIVATTIDHSTDEGRLVFEH